LYQEHNPDNPLEIFIGEGITIFDGKEHYLPTKVQEWAGLDSNDGTYESKEETTESLTNHNDDDRYRFNKIARIIQENF
jgi:hypothetical protein